MKNQNKTIQLRFIRKTAALLLAAVVLCAGLNLQARADDLWNEDYYRASDVTGDLSEAQQQSLDTSCIDFMKEQKLDISLLVTTKDHYPDATIDELAAGYYEDCGFGYGETKDGYSVVIDADTLDVAIVPMGNTKGIIPQKYLDFVKQSAPKYQEEYGSFGLMYCCYRMITSYITDNADGIKRDAGDFAVTQKTEELDQEIEDAAPETEEGAAESVSAQKEDPDAINEQTDATRAVLSPEELSKIVTCNALYDRIESMDADATRGETDPETEADESRPRVVDEADLFTDEEEKELEARLLEIRKEIHADFVIYTDNTDYGKGKDIYSADFYDYNGYGCGKEFTGACLFICMDPNNRGFYTCCTGPKVRNNYTEYEANLSDDAVYVCVKDKYYAKAAAVWAENMRRITLYGSSIAYDWVMAKETDQAKAADGVARVVDDAFLLSDTQIESLEKEAKRIADTYHTDVAIHTVYDAWELTREEYADKYWRMMGYGQGESRDGFLITIYKKYGYSGSAVVRGYGAAAEHLNDIAISRLQSRTMGKVNDSDLENRGLEGLTLYLSMLEHYIRKGRVPRSMGSWIGFTIFELLIALIVAAIMHAKAKKGMETPAIKENASAYMVPRSLRVKKLRDTYLRSSESRKYDPPSESRSSGSSSGRSSYSSSYSGSSGRSHSGSGRSF